MLFRITMKALELGHLDQRTQHHPKYPPELRISVALHMGL